jgi:hypothetical protein
VSCVHQHDAPLADLSAQAFLVERGLAGQWIDPAFHRQATQAVAGAVRAAMEKTEPVTHIGMGKAIVNGVASNRRYIGAKYNGGEPENRAVLADRLHSAMRQAWDATKRVPVESVTFRSIPFELAPRDDPGFRVADLQAKLVPEQDPRTQCLAALGLSWRQRVAAGEKLDLAAVDFGPAVFLLLPAESYVEYQLLASRLRPDDFVLVAGYGECGPGYIPHEQAWAENDANLNDWCWVAPGAEAVLSAAIQKALSVESKNERVD